MKKIEVVAAIIIKDNKILSTQRSYGDYKGYWEFPGGKMEASESQQEALIREIKEELDADIEVEKYFMSIEYDYPTFHLLMHSYICTLKSDCITLLEHSDAKWLNTHELDLVEWLEADIPITSKLKDIF